MDQLTTKPIWILGGGKFGRQAAESLLRRGVDNHIVLIDTNERLVLPQGIEYICSDGVSWLTEQLTPDAEVGAIIPALPLHLAAEWLKKRLYLDGFTVAAVDLPDQLLQLLPHPLRQSSSQAVISHADFLCPVHCREPEDVCSFTGQPRPPALYSLLEQSSCAPLTPLICTSRQFFAGAGGFYPADLWQLRYRAISHLGIPLLIGTACKCHGIIDGLLITKS
jgi:hypothetical protein